MKGATTKKEEKNRKTSGQSATVALWRLKDIKAKVDSTVWPLLPGTGVIKRKEKKKKILNFLDNP